MVPPHENELRSLYRRISALEEEVDQRHEDNLKRFASLEKAAAEIRGEMKIVILLLIAQLGTNVAHLFGG